MQSVWKNEADSGKRERETEEVKVKVALQVEGEGECRISTSSAFFDHMLHLLGKHALFNLEVEASSKSVGLHHLVEEVGICLGEAFLEALEGKEGLLWERPTSCG
jgi:imidazoleglycerol-phosphate dehydratase